MLNFDGICVVLTVQYVQHLKISELMVKVLQLWLGRGGDDHLVCGRFWETCKTFSSTGDVKLQGHEE